ncbi:MAG: amino-acid N-acetyltransferase [Spirochaeta sp.]|jgi:amino-acid N-acetyltransferase|nr:amino-acid N-acetyltransferase [Spirochaeta sp.]
MNSADLFAQVDLIRQVFSYTHRFRGKTFVLHVDYGAVDDDGLSALVQDVVLLHQAGIRIILVPGARQRIDEVLTRYDVSWRREDGVRIASPEAIPFIKMAAFDVSNRFMTLLSAHHTNAVVGNWVKARGIGVVDGVDYQHTGVVERVQLELLQSTLKEQLIPIFPCIGWSVSGKPYNISSRELAYRIAVSIQAEKLFFVSDKMGLTNADVTVPAEVEVTETGRISRLTVDETSLVLAANGIDAAPEQDVGTEPDERAGVLSAASGYFTGERDSLELLRLAHRAAGHGVNRVHIVSGRQEGVVLVEVFSSLGVGTMVYANVYQSIRPMRVEDVSKVHRLLQPLARQGVLIRRTPEDITAHYTDYVVHETDGRIHGCGALHRYNNGEAEIAAIAVDPMFEELGIGRRIVLYLMERAREAHLPAVFVLTTRTGDWFESIGYERVSVNELPQEKRERYDVDRNSIVLRYRF